LVTSDTCGRSSAGTSSVGNASRAASIAIST
jgi:hypothetical protein